jgi:predicted ester cyclase
MSTQQETSVEHDDEVLRIAVEMGKVFNDGDDEVARRLVASDFVDHEAPEGTPGGPDGYAATARWMRGVWTDARWDIVDGFAKGDKATLRVIFSGKHDSEFMGVQPTGNKVEVQHIHIYRVADGQVVEHWAVRDDLEVARQIGAWTKPRAGGQR